MKKTIAVIGSAAALSFAGAGLAAAQEVTEDEIGPATEAPAEITNEDDEDDVTDPETPGEVSQIAQQLCGTISAYDFLGSAGALAPGLSGDECEANADLAIEAAQNGDIAGAIDILRGIEAELPDDGDNGAGDEDGAGDNGDADNGAGDEDGAGDNGGADDGDAGNGAGDDEGADAA